MGQFHAVFFIWSSCQLCLYSHQHIYQQLLLKYKTCPHRKHNYLKPKIISVLAAVSVGWCEPVLAPWPVLWRTHCWGTVVTAQLPKALATSGTCCHQCVSVSTQRGSGEQHSIVTSPLFVPRTGAERHRQHLCTVIPTISAKDSVQRSPKPQERLSLSPGTLWLVCSHSLLDPASGIANQDAVCEGGSYILLHTRAQQEPRWGCDWFIIHCRQTTPDLAFPQSESDSLHWCLKVCPSIFKHSKCAFCSPQPLAFPLTIWPMVTVNFCMETSPITADCCNVQTGSMVNSWSC